MKQTFLTTIMLFCLTAICWAEGNNTQVETSSTSDAWTEIRNGELWIDTDGNSVQAHAPGFLKMGDTWFMVGEDRGHSWNPDVNLYSSKDLQHWTFIRKIIENGVTSPDLGRRRMIERAKLLYNEKTQKFVVWCHWESRNYGASEAACFESDSIDGTYRLVWSGRPMGIKSRDCNVFVDDDGTAYFISTTEENTNLGLFRLSDDYLTPVSHTPLFEGDRREAPAIVRIGDTYFMFNSACSGWRPNQCKMSYTKDLTTGWIPLRNIGDEVAYRTQAAAILTIKGSKQTTYLYVGDRWMDPDLPRSKTIIFPITFNGTDCEFHYMERFEINYATGEWREVK
ncbi:MAG: family 43 glycosylhydrolase [Prevotella sp.]|nr:family 43 glycosylhydrolase [Prevotella sp.]